MVKGRIIQFRRSRSSYKPRHFLVEVPECDSREKADKFRGREIEWKSPAEKVIKGKIASAHGNKGVLRAVFERGLPGQAIGTEAEVK